MRKIIAIAPLAMLAACANTTGVIPMGQGTYTTTVEHRGFNASMGDAKVLALKEAADFCQDKGGDFQVVNSTDVPRALFQFPHSSLQFRCVNK